MSGEIKNGFEELAADYNVFTSIELKLALVRSTVAVLFDGCFRPRHCLVADWPSNHLVVPSCAGWGFTAVFRVSAGWSE